MILMAIDHVRVYSGLPAGGPTWGIFFTRWITHFVAPGFVFLAGTAAYFHGRKLHNRTALSKFLFTRGAWLVLLELTFIRICWTFNFDFAHYLLAGIIWMIGICMMLMAGLIYLPIKLIGAIGVAIIALHNLTNTSVLQGQLEHCFGENGPNWFWSLLYFDGGFQLGGSGPPLFILYVIVPWIGVMMAGYAFGLVMEMPQDRRGARLSFHRTSHPECLWGSAPLGQSSYLARVSKHHQISGLAFIPADDAGADVHPSGVRGTLARQNRRRDRNFWPRSFVLLLAAHSSHPRRGLRGVDNP